MSAQPGLVWSHKKLARVSRHLASHTVLLAALREGESDDEPPELTGAAWEQRTLALRAVARGLTGAEPYCERDVLHKVYSYRRIYRRRLRRLAQVHAERGAPLDTALETAPRWLRSIERHVRLLPRIVQEEQSRPRAVEAADAAEAEATRRAERLAETLVDALAARWRVTRRADDDTAAFYDLTVDTGARAATLALLWSRMRSLAMQKLHLLLEAGDRESCLPRAALMSQVAWRVADLVLLYDDSETVVSEDSLLMYEQLQALTMMFHLAQAYELEERGTADDWARAHEAYTTRSMRGTRASLVLLQRRWHELKAQTRARLTALWRRTPAERRAAPRAASALPIHQAIARRFPHVVTAPLPSWGDLVRSGRIHLPPVKHVHSDVQSGPVQEVDGTGERTHPATVEVHTWPPDESDNDLILVERHIETIDLDEVEGSSAAPATTVPERAERPPPVKEEPADVRQVLFERRQEICEQLEQDLDKQLSDIERHHSGGDRPTDGQADGDRSLLTERVDFDGALTSGDNSNSGHSDSDVEFVPQETTGPSNTEDTSVSGPAGSLNVDETNADGGGNPGARNSGILDTGQGISVLEKLDPKDAEATIIFSDDDDSDDFPHAVGGTGCITRRMSDTNDLPNTNNDLNSNDLAHGKSNDSSNINSDNGDLHTENINKDASAEQSNNNNVSHLNDESSRDSCDSDALVIDDSTRKDDCVNVRSLKDHSYAHNAHSRPNDDGDANEYAHIDDVRGDSTNVTVTDVAQDGVNLEQLTVDSQNCANFNGSDEKPFGGDITLEQPIDEMQIDENSALDDVQSDANTNKSAVDDVQCDANTNSAVDVVPRVANSNSFNLVDENLNLSTADVGQSKVDSNPLVADDDVQDEASSSDSNIKEVNDDAVSNNIPATNDIEDTEYPNEARDDLNCNDVVKSSLNISTFCGNIVIDQSSSKRDSIEDINKCSNDDSTVTEVDAKEENVTIQLELELESNMDDKNKPKIDNNSEIERIEPKYEVTEESSEENGPIESVRNLDADMSELNETTNTNESINPSNKNEPKTTGELQKKSNIGTDVTTAVKTEGNGTKTNVQNEQDGEASESMIVEPSDPPLVVTPDQTCSAVQESERNGRAGTAEPDRLDLKLLTRTAVKVIKLDSLPFWRRHAAGGTVDLAHVDLRQFRHLARRYRQVRLGGAGGGAGDDRREGRITYYISDLSRNPDFDIRLKNLPPSFFLNERNVQLLELCTPVSVDLERVSAGAAQERRGASRRGRVAKRVELPDIEEVRRVNSSLLTAQVAPLGVLQVTNGEGEESRTSAADSVSGSASPSGSDSEWGGSEAGAGRAAGGPQPGNREPAEPWRGDEMPSFSELQRLLKQLSRQSQNTRDRKETPVGSRAGVIYCCLARKHRAINDARRRLHARAGRQGALVDLPIHAHSAEDCNCCCVRLVEARGEVAARLAAAARALQRDLAALDDQTSNYSPSSNRKEKNASTNGEKSKDKEKSKETDKGKEKSSKKKKKKSKDTQSDEGDDETLADEYDEWMRQRSLGQKYFHIHSGHATKRSNVDQPSQPARRTGIHQPDRCSIDIPKQPDKHTHVVQLFDVTSAQTRTGLKIVKLKHKEPTSPDTNITDNTPAKRKYPDDILEMKRPDDLIKVPSKETTPMPSAQPTRPKMPKLTPTVNANDNSQPPSYLSHFAKKSESQQFPPLVLSQSHDPVPPGYQSVLNIRVSVAPQKLNTSSGQIVTDQPDSNKPVLAFSLVNPPTQTVQENRQGSPDTAMPGSAQDQTRGAVTWIPPPPTTNAGSTNQQAPGSVAGETLNVLPLTKYNVQSHTKRIETSSEKQVVAADPDSATLTLTQHQSAPASSRVTSPAARARARATSRTTSLAVVRGARGGYMLQLTPPECPPAAPAHSAAAPDWKLSLAPPTPLAEFMAGRDPTTVTVLCVDSAQPLLRLAGDYLVITPLEVPVTSRTYWTMAPRGHSRRILFPSRPSPSPSPTRSRSLLLPRSPAAAAAGEAEAEAEAGAPPPDLVYTDNRLYKSLADYSDRQWQTPLYAQVLTVVSELSTCRRLVRGGAAVQLYSVQTGRPVPLLRCALPAAGTPGAAVPVTAGAPGTAAVGLHSESEALPALRDLVSRFNAEMTPPESDARRIPTAPAPKLPAAPRGGPKGGGEAASAGRGGSEGRGAAGRVDTVIELDSDSD